LRSSSALRNITRRLINLDYYAYISLEKEKSRKTVYADNAYSGQEQLEGIRKKEAISRVCEKGYRNKPLTETQKKRNRKISKHRSRIEHVFGHMTMSMGGIVIRCVGLARAEVAIVMKNLAYNMKRYCVLASA
jgi:IS5 family transposase